MSKDWIGNARSAFTCNGASNHSDKERETNDYYATEPKAIDVLVLEGGQRLTERSGSVLAEKVICQSDCRNLGTPLRVQT